MAKIKTVFDTGRIAGIWLWGTQNYARNPQDNFYFSGDTIYSYGTHFPIARKLPDGAILFTLQTYSNTTAKHISEVSRAVRNKDRVIYTFDLDDKERNVPIWVGRIDELILQIRNKKNRKFDGRISEIKTYIKQLKSYVEYFKIPVSFETQVMITYFTAGIPNEQIVADLRDLPFLPTAKKIA